METTVTSSSKVPLFGLILLIISTVVVGVAVGAAVAFVSQFFYLIILMPIIMAAAGGFGIATAVKMGKVRSGLVAALFGLLCGLLIYGTYRYGEYLIFRQQVHDQVLEEARNRGADTSQITSAQVESFIDEFLTDEVEQSGFVGFTMYRAKEGEQIRLGRGSGTPITLPTPITWIYWIIEALVVIGGSAVMAAGAATEPFCERDNKFFKERTLGNVAKENVEAFMNAVQANNWQGARALVMNDKPAYPYLEVKVKKCPDCNTNPVEFELSRKLNSKSSDDQSMLTSTITPQQFSELEGSLLMA